MGRSAAAAPVAVAMPAGGGEASGSTEEKTFNVVLQLLELPKST